MRAIVVRSLLPGARVVRADVFAEVRERDRRDRTHHEIHSL